MENVDFSSINLPVATEQKFDGITAGIRTISILGIIALSLFLNLWHNDFPLGYHVDEMKKTSFILTGRQDFKHPILMLNIVRFVNLFLKIKDPQKIVELGRSITGIFATMAVLVFFLIARSLLPHPFDLFVALAWGTSPILVVHAHYLKEDVLFLFFALLSLYTFLSLVKEPTDTKIFWLGLAYGLANSSHYKGILLLPLFFMGTMFCESGKKFFHVKHVIRAVPIALWVFMAVNYPIFFDTLTLQRGIAFEYHHVTKVGEGLKIYPLPHFFSFHLVYSILPGMTLPLTIFALLALIYCLYNWKKLLFGEKFVLLYLLIFYFAVELSPLKIFPAYMRYALPVVPGLLYFVCRGFLMLETANNFHCSRLIFRSILFLSILFSCQKSFLLTYFLNNDTRERARKIAKNLAGKTHFEFYAGAKPGPLTILFSMRSFRRRGIRYLAVSSFWFKRYEFGAKLKDQIPLIYSRNEYYQRLFQYPYIEVEPAYITFAFSNPLLRIVDIGKALPDPGLEPIPEDPHGDRARRRLEREKVKIEMQKRKAISSKQ
ncbi:ArnT family glycosyltransferase [Candidatus Riflebacteria bacterium]